MRDVVIVSTTRTAIGDFGGDPLSVGGGLGFAMVIERL